MTAIPFPIHEFDTPRRAVSVRLMLRNAGDFVQASGRNALFLTVGMLFCLLLWPVAVVGLWWLNRKLRTILQKPLVIDRASHADFRMLSDRLSGLAEMKPTRQGNTRKLPHIWILSGQIGQLDALLQAFYQKLQGHFDALDRVPVELPTGWRVVTGRELWENRPDAYKNSPYLL